jgi:hypothetical protein
MYSDNLWDKVTAGRVYPSATRYTRSLTLDAKRFSFARLVDRNTAQRIVKPEAYKSISK